MLDQFGGFTHYHRSLSLPMKTRPIALFGLLLSGQLLAQVPTELFIGHRKAQYELFWSRPIDSAGRFTFFNYNRLAIDYRNRGAYEFVLYSVGQYNLNKTVGVAVGGYAYNGGVIPVAAVSLTWQGKDWFVNLFPTFELRPNPNYELFGFANYTPHLTDKTRLFGQLIVNTNFNFQQHNLSVQQLRLGLSRGGFQFGTGLDLNAISLPEQTQFSTNAGLFVRKEL